MRGHYLAYSRTSRDRGTRKERSHVRRWTATETIHMMRNPSAMRMQFAVAKSWAYIVIDHLHNTAPANAYAKLR